jgi:hypothetical protein
MERFFIKGDRRPDLEMPGIPLNRTQAEFSKLKKGNLLHGNLENIAGHQADVTRHWFKPTILVPLVPLVRLVKAKLLYLGYMERTFIPGHQHLVIPLAYGVQVV